MNDLRDRIYEVVSGLKTARARDAAAAILEVLAELAKKGQVVVRIRGEERGFVLSADDGGSLKSIAPGDKLGRPPILLDVSVDRERFADAVERARSIQDLAFQSGVRVRGSSPFIVAASGAINRRVFKLALEGG